MLTSFCKIAVFVNVFECKISSIMYIECKRAVFRIQFHFRSSDADDFDYIFCMDYSNVQNVKRVLPQSAHSKVLLLGSFDPQGVEEIEDPYYGSEDGFDVCFEHCGRCLDEFIKQKLLALTS